MSKRENCFLPGRELRVKTDVTGSTLVGVIPYNSPSAGLPWIETIQPGAFSDALKAGADVLMLRDHDPSLLLGRTTAGTLTLSDSPQGLQFRCKLPNTTTASDLIESLKRFDITGNSFGFTVQDNGGDSWADDGKGNLVRSLRAVNLFELSVCSFPAFTDSQVSLRSVPQELRSLLKRSKNDDGDSCGCDCEACQAGDCSDCEDEDCTDPNCDHGERSARHWAERSRMWLELAKRR